MKVCLYACTVPNVNRSLRSFPFLLEERFIQIEGPFRKEGAPQDPYLSKVKTAATPSIIKST